MKDKTPDDWKIFLANFESQRQNDNAQDAIHQQRKQGPERNFFAAMKGYGYENATKRGDFKESGRDSRVVNDMDSARAKKKISTTEYLVIKA